LRTVVTAVTFPSSVSVRWSLLDELAVPSSGVACPVASIEDSAWVAVYELSADEATEYLVVTVTSEESKAIPERLNSDRDVPLELMFVISNETDCCAGLTRFCVAAPPSTATVVVVSSSAVGVSTASERSTSTTTETVSFEIAGFGV
jgi:hypothetical protein